MKKKEVIYWIIFFYSVIACFLEIFNKMPGDLRFIGKIVSLFSFGVLLYSLSPMRIIFGKNPVRHIAKNNIVKNRYIDVILICAFFMLSFGDIAAFATGIEHELIIFSGIPKLLGGKALQLFLFQFGAIAFLSLSIFLGFKVVIDKNSLMGVIHEDLAADTFNHKMARTISIFVIICTIYITYFNFMSEWMIFVLDNPLTLAGVILIILALRKNYDTKINFIQEKLETVNKFFEEDLFNFFHSKRKLFDVISGFLILHVIVEVYNFLLPYLTKFGSDFYQTFIENKSWIGDSIANEVPGTSALLLIIKYSLIAIFMSATMLLPIYNWYSWCKKKQSHIPSFFSGIYAASAVIFLYFVSASMSSIINIPGIVGVKYGILISPSTDIIALIIAILLSCMVFSATLILSHYKKIRVFLNAALQLPSILFLAKYSYKFIVSIAGYYSGLIFGLVADNLIFTTFIMAVFAILTIIFYVSSFVTYIYQLWHYHKEKHTS